MSHFGFVGAVGEGGGEGDLRGRRFCDLQTSNTCSLRLLGAYVSVSLFTSNIVCRDWDEKYWILCCGMKKENLVENLSILCFPAFEWSTT